MTNAAVKCSANGCLLPVHGRGFCKCHYDAWRRGGREPGHEVRQSNRIVNADGYVQVQRNGGQTREHIVVAELALGKRLPARAVVHHLDEDPTNNERSNLVICPNQSYHLLLHQRLRALEACGNANYRRCPFCKTYDDPSLMVACNATMLCHRACRTAKDKQRRAAR